MDPADPEPERSKAAPPPGGERATPPQDAPEGPRRRSEVEPEAPPGAGDELPSDPAVEALERRLVAELGLEPEAPAEAVGRARRRGLAGRFKEGLVDLATKTYDARADDLQERALSAMREAIAREGQRLADLAASSYDARADDLEERAVRAIRKVMDEEAERLLALAMETYDARADDLEERAARALRAALIHESRRLQAVIEHSVVVKRKEVRLSLLVLVVANLIYLAVYWITG